MYIKKVIAPWLSLILLFLFHSATAHPGIGLTMDSKGNIYYTDLKQIWKQTPQGNKTIAVLNVHSHELYMDKNDNLFGEHLWYDAATTRFYNYQWCLKNTGELIKTSDTLDTYRQAKNYSYTRDDYGNMYWYQVAARDTFHFIKRDSSGKKTIIASGIFKDIRWVFSTPKGEIYFLDLDDLFRITSPNKFQLIANNLCTGSLWTAFFGKQHSVFGVWFDSEGNIYAAVTEDKCIKKITPSGKVSVVYKSVDGAPVNGLFDPQGNLWVLDGQGVKKIQLKDISKTKVWMSNNAPYLLSLSGIAIVLMLIKQIRKKRRS